MIPVATRWNRPVLNTTWLIAAMALPASLLAFRWLGDVPSGEVGHLLLDYSFLPRIAVSLLAGAALGLSGAVLQTLLRNPLAEPTTLGTSAGAQLALTVATLYWPILPLAGREAIAALGAALATCVSCGLAWRTGLSPLTFIIGGLLINLLCGAVAAVAGLLNAAQMSSVFVWSTGSLVQYDWTPAIILLFHLTIAGCCVTLAARPLSTLALDDEAVRSLGVPLRSLRLVALAVAVALAASVVSVVGVIGFVGLAAPALCRLTGSRSFRAQIVGAPVLGSLLLCLTDQIILAAGHWSAALPTGTAAALLGAPLLLWLLPLLQERRPVAILEPSLTSTTLLPRHVIAVFAFLLGGVLLTFSCGRGVDGWTVSVGPNAWSVLQWRWPHVVASAAAGAMLAAAGSILQRLTGNSMASPEILGVSAGAAMGVILLVFIFGSVDEGGRLAGAAAGAAAILGMLLTIARRVGFSPQRLLLAGVATTTVFSAIAALLVASGDPRMQMRLGWMSGSTYQVTPREAAASAAACMLLLATSALIARPLAVVPLGRDVGQALGLSVWGGQTSLLLMASLLTAAGTLVVGPLTFVGLMGPPFARMLGFRGAMVQLFAAVGFGAIIMMLADWLGRNLLFPYQVPAGLLAAIVGCPLLLWSMWRKR